tara:strand:+ start:116 stop:328 length:213 start_codon:yes stop_codon:yes gene_type:complete
MNFEIGDRVKRNTSTSVPLVGIVRGVISVPPPRWEENGQEQISYNVFFPTIGSQSNIAENELIINTDGLI